MKAKQTCEICGHFKVVGFTDCGLICEECFNKEIMINAFNEGVEHSAKIAENYEKTTEVWAGVECSRMIRNTKKKTHRKENDNLQQR